MTEIKPGEFFREGNTLKYAFKANQGPAQLLEAFVREGYADTNGNKKIDPEEQFGYMAGLNALIDANRSLGQSVSEGVVWDASILENRDKVLHYPGRPKDWNNANWLQYANASLSDTDLSGLKQGFSDGTNRTGQWMSQFMTSETTTAPTPQTASSAGTASIQSPFPNTPVPANADINGLWDKYEDAWKQDGADSLNNLPPEDVEKIKNWNRFVFTNNPRVRRFTESFLEENKTLKPGESMLTNDLSLEKLYQGGPIGPLGIAYPTMEGALTEKYMFDFKNTYQKFQTVYTYPGETVWENMQALGGLSTKSSDGSADITYLRPEFYQNGYFDINAAVSAFQKEVSPTLTAGKEYDYRPLLNPALKDVTDLLANDFINEYAVVSRPYQPDPSK